MVDISRRALLGGITAAGLTGLTASESLAQKAVPAANGPVAASFNYDDVVKRARDLASVAYDGTLKPLPEGLGSLDFDAWRDIRFRNDKALLADLGSPFQMQMFHLGYLFQRPVTINTVRNGIATPVPYTASLFDYGRNVFKKPLPVNLGFAGFRLQFPLNKPLVFDEVIEFLGASYFRFLGRHQNYGLSARAIAINSGSEPEEFPFFREFWVMVPEPGASRVTIFALLDGESVTGAYRLDVMPAIDTTVEITATLFPRRAIAKLGIAPLSSMFFSGKTSRRFVNDYRGELHDSDGLFLRTETNEQIWRPLQNPFKTQVSDFITKAPKAFGLLQRDRVFDHYQDIDLTYQTRPSYLVEPHDEWAQGSVELIEIPTSDETNDNIVTFWTPTQKVEANKSLVFNYRLTALADEPRLSPGGWAVNTFISSASEPGLTGKPTPGQQRFIIDFTGGDLAYFAVDPAEVQLVPTVTRGKIVRSSLVANPHVAGFRGFIDIAVPLGETTDLRAFLKAGSRALTETWTFRWNSA